MQGKRHKKEQNNTKREKTREKKENGNHFKTLSTAPINHDKTVQRMLVLNNLLHQLIL